MDELVSTQWLGERLGDAGPAILDASSHLPTAGRDARAEFAAAHIPGARFLDLATLIDPTSAVPSALPTAAQVAERLASLGIAADRKLVVYDDSAVRTAARTWFALRMYGLDVAILDGGLGKWRADGLPLESGPADPPAPTQAASLAAEWGEVRSKADVMALLEGGAETLVDARDAARFAGEAADFRPGVAEGHIPGSRNLPFDRVLNADGTYKDPAAIRAAFAEAGVDLDAPLVTTCGGGVTAAVLLFALRLAGKHDVALYDGSWSEWGADPATPKATGPAA